MVWPRDREDPELPGILTEQFRRDLHSLNEMALWLQERNRMTVKLTRKSAHQAGVEQVINYLADIPALLTVVIDEATTLRQRAQETHESLTG